ncbi:MAG TPA: sulfatase [Verrucomicrobiae bacterium]|jgi:arylsulfatase A-like enzyme
MRTFLLLLLAAAAPLNMFADSLPAKPNFIFILADDMGYGDIGPFGSAKNRTPNLDRMAREGMKLTSFYGAPLCTPSRAQVLTGCYAKRVSLPDVLFPRSPIGISSDEATIGSLLKSLGYATIAIGKWHVGDAPPFLPTHHGFDHYLGLPYSNDMGGEVPGKNTDKWSKHTPPLPLVRDGEVIEALRPKDQDKLTALYTDEAVKFIRENKNRPFFLYLPHTAVHVPLHPGHKFRGKSANGLYGDWVEEIDWCVGRVMSTVHELGLDDRTLIVFSSDNGPWLAKGTNAGNAGPLRGGKGGTFEGGEREPTLAWWPGHVPAGQVCDAVAANIDLLPTFVHLAGGAVPPERKIDGRDISPLLLGLTTESPHEAFFYIASKSIQAVRSGPWKLAIATQYEGIGPYTDIAPNLNKPFTPRLYNLDKDIGERSDAAAENPEVVRRLESYLREMDGDLGVGKVDGPGVRPPGRVAHPTGLWLRGQQPPEPTAYQPADELHVGDVIESEEAPQIAGKSLRIVCEVKPESDNAVIVAQGGSKVGYALYLADGLPAFSVRENGKLFTVKAAERPGRDFKLDAQLLSNGSMTLAVDGKISATGAAPGLVSGQPKESMCVGFDDGAAVAKYKQKAKEPFQGKLTGLSVMVGPPYQ